MLYIWFTKYTLTPYEVCRHRSTLIPFKLCPNIFPEKNPGIKNRKTPLEIKNKITKSRGLIDSGVKHWTPCQDNSLYIRKISSSSTSDARGTLLSKEGIIALSAGSFITLDTLHKSPNRIGFHQQLQGFIISHKILLRIDTSPYRSPKRPGRALGRLWYSA